MNEKHECKYCKKVDYCLKFSDANVCITCWCDGTAEKEIKETGKYIMDKFEKEMRSE